MTEPVRWEYWSGILDAEPWRKIKDDYEETQLPRYSPQWLMPKLDSLGDEGWELVHMEPVVVGSNADVLMIDTMRTWTHSYFCVFKRPRRL
jgi:hypothetical protein